MSRKSLSRIAKAQRDADRKVRSGEWVAVPRRIAQQDRQGYQPKARKTVVSTDAKLVREWTDAKLAKELALLVDEAHRRYPEGLPFKIRRVL